MIKEDNEWSIEHGNLSTNKIIVNINGEKYYMDEEFSGLTHAILLLIDAVNDKRIK